MAEDRLPYPASSSPTCSMPAPGFSRFFSLQIVYSSRLAGSPRWVFEIKQLKSWRLGVRSPTLAKWLRIADAAEALCTRQDVAYWLVKHQLLQVERLPKVKGVGFWVSRSEIAAFEPVTPSRRNWRANLACPPGS